MQLKTKRQRTEHNIKLPRPLIILSLVLSVLVLSIALIAFKAARYGSDHKTYNPILSQELDRLQLPINSVYHDEDFGPGFCESPCVKLDRVYASSGPTLDSVRSLIISNLSSNGYHDITNIEQVISAQHNKFSIAIYSEKVAPSHSIDVYLSVL